MSSEPSEQISLTLAEIEAIFDAATRLMYGDPLSEVEQSALDKLGAAYDALGGERYGS